MHRNQDVIAYYTPRLCDLATTIQGTPLAKTLLAARDCAYKQVGCQQPKSKLSTMFVMNLQDRNKILLFGFGDLCF